MFRNYFKTALSNILKYKVNSFINILGLTLGLTCSVLILIDVVYEMSYDRFHEKAGRIYRLGREMVFAEGEKREPRSSAPAGNALLEFPEVENMVRFKDAGQTAIRYNDNIFYEKKIYFVDPSVFNVFTLPVINGPASALDNPFQVVITCAMKEKYFGETDPVGKVLQFDNGHDYMVSGVIEDLPRASHLKINMLCSMSTLKAINDPALTDWSDFGFSTYLLLKENADVTELSEKFPDFISRYMGETPSQEYKALQYYLHPLTKIHLYSHLDGNSPGLIMQVFYYSLLAIFIILIASINFMSLTTAQAMSRSREIAMRKVLGANQSRLRKQFLFEAMLFSFLGFLLSIVLIKLLLPAFSNLVDAELDSKMLYSPVLIGGILLIVLFVGFLSGIYPAFYLSRLQPIEALKEQVKGRYRKYRARSVMVIVQFVLSSMLVTQTVIITNQLVYMKNKDIGFNKQDVIILPILDESVRHSLELVKKEMTALPLVSQISAASRLPGLGIPRDLKQPEGFTPDNMQLMDDINVDADFLLLLGIEFTRGRNFSESISTDQQQGIIVNELAVKKFRWQNPLGKTVRNSAGDGSMKTGVVVGVVRDFHLSSMHRMIAPLFISNNPVQLNHILVRVERGKAEQALESIEQKWGTIFPDLPFQFTFLEDRYDRYFRTIESVVQVMIFFSVIAIMLAGLGIFALSVFISRQQTKEIGIRKVLGGTVAGIVVRLNFLLLRHVVAATLILVPFSFFVNNLIRGIFPYMADIGTGIYLKSVALVLLIAVISVSYQCFRAAMADPVKTLKYE